MSTSMRLDYNAVAPRGTSIEQLAPVQAWAEAGNVFDEREGAALAWAETVTRVAETGVPPQAALAR
jgi:alkylhydroperoxidase family enzyme